MRHLAVQNTVPVPTLNPLEKENAGSWPTRRSTTFLDEHHWLCLPWRPGEAPADLLSRLNEKSSQKPPHSANTPEKHKAPGTERFRGLEVVAGARSDRLHTAWIPLVLRMQFSS